MIFNTETVVYLALAAMSSNTAFAAPLFSARAANAAAQPSEVAANGFTGSLPPNLRQKSNVNVKENQPSETTGIVGSPHPMLRAREARAEAASVMLRDAIMSSETGVLETRQVQEIIDLFKGSSSIYVDSFHYGTEGGVPDQNKINRRLKCWKDFAIRGWGDFTCDGDKYFRGGSWYDSPSDCYGACSEVSQVAITQGMNGFSCNHRASNFSKCWIGIAWPN